MDAIYKKALSSFNGDDLATSVYLKKYAMTDGDGNIIETSLSETKERLVNAIMVKENKKEMREKYRNLLNRFLPGGRIMYGLGNESDEVSTLSNCYVIGNPSDSIESIFEIAKKQAMIFSKGGGVGLDVSGLRPKNAKVNNSAKTTSGVVSFMDLYSQVTGLIAMHNRRGALMITLSCTHPDLIEFIKIKGGNDNTKIQFANISIRISDEFMKAVENDDDWEMKFTTQHETIIKTEKAKKVWELIVESNWKGAEPGLLFWDKVLTSPSSCFEKSRPIGTNPCGEQPLPAWGSCNLGSMNLPCYVKESFTENAYFDFDLFSEDVKTATRFMDTINIINKDRQPLPENKEMIELTNAIGLGVTGLADMLIKLNLKYDTDEAVYKVGEVFKSLKENTVKASIDLVNERGVFPLLVSNKEEQEKFRNHPHFDFLKEVGNEDYLKRFRNNGIRNSQYNTVAPNGSLSIILQGSSGLEPIFYCEYERTTLTGDESKPTKYIVQHPLVKEYERITGKSYKDNPNFITAEEIDWAKRIDIQAVCQKYLSESISSTVNLPTNVSTETISNIYMTAWKKGLKGITIYRAGSRDGVLNKIEQKNSYTELPVKPIGVKFPDSTNAKMRIIRSENKKWYVTYTIDEESGLPNSLFVNTNSSEASIVTNEVLDACRLLATQYIDDGLVEQLDHKTNHQSNVVKTARFLSLLLRHRVPMLKIIKTIEHTNIPVNSFAYRIKGLLAEFVEGAIDGNCPECKSKMRYEGGCSICINCGYSKCG